MAAASAQAQTQWPVKWRKSRDRRSARQVRVQRDNNNENVYDVIIWIHHVKSLVTITTMTEKQAGILNCETCDHERFGRENPDPDIYV